MSIGWMVVLFIAIFAALLLVVPLHFVVDSKEKRFSVRWLFLSLAFRFPDKRLEIRFFGIRFRTKKKKPAAPPPEPPPEEETMEEEKEERPSFVSVLLSRRSLMIQLAELSVQYTLELLRAFSISHLRLDLSFDDPMINGICYGSFQGVRMKRVHLAVNFWGENRFVGAFALPLYRMVIPTLRLLFKLPYRELYRVFREIRHPDRVRREEVSA
ncbi:hypothetical protein [Candidatus Manganitrophus noduliformans]|uniref:DUF2953 domain-containing protein n=1 Tax=Candidatus Manganitrophus noduliformans TaxID=2606439 RepID=A0A7X6DQB1_9BACT|nr:hypothetical protein [Candidatus Manganitrophus noduliformans]NKE71118.1 hypothetical protein [Candidatus Manganitrophus noduliformans]